MHPLRFFATSVGVCVAACVTGFTCTAAEESDSMIDIHEKIDIHEPQPHQVIQRTDYDPTHAWTNAPGGPRLGEGRVVIRATLPPQSTRMRVRVVPRDGSGTEPSWVEIAEPASGKEVVSELRNVPAGWYRLQMQALREDAVVADSVVEPIGIGEVLVVAGQSYATNTNEEVFKVSDPLRRVSAYDFSRGNWQIAHDPQPTPDGSNGGSIWPPVGEMLVQSLQVPVGFVNVAYGGTSSAQWMPGNPLHDRLKQVHDKVGPFRAVLWQQGESDVIGKTSTDQYVENLRAIRQSAGAAWGFDPPWLLAKSTLHPTVYVDPEGEARIRAAIDTLCQNHGFLSGPDTDTLGGEYRGAINTRRHFSGPGQRAAALLWFAKLHEHVASVPREASAAQP